MAKKTKISKKPKSPGKIKSAAARDIREMMDNWNHIEATLKRQHPSAPDEQIYRMASSAMNSQLKLPADFNNEYDVLLEFCQAEGCKPDYCTSIKEDKRLQGFGVGTYYQITREHDHDYTIAKNADSLRDLAVEIVKQDLNDSPENFNQDWLSTHVDMDALRKILRPDVEDSNRDHAKDVGARRFWDATANRGIDIPDDVQDALDAGEDPREPNYDEVETLVEDMTNDQLRDPMEYMVDIYGRDEAATQAIKIAGIDVDQAAENAVDTDGPEHFVAHYDGKSRETKSGFVYWRTN
jgi:hypothetical protein